MKFSITVTEGFTCEGDERNMSRFVIWKRKRTSEIYEQVYVAADKNFNILMYENLIHDIAVGLMGAMKIEKRKINE